MLERCYICFDLTDTYYINNNCNCKIYCHESCLNLLCSFRKCIICKKIIYLSYDSYLISFINLNNSLYNIIYNIFIKDSIIYYSDIEIFFKIYFCLLTSFVISFPLLLLFFFKKYLYKYNNCSFIKFYI